MMHKCLILAFFGIIFNYSLNINHTIGFIHFEKISYRIYSKVDRIFRFGRRQISTVY